jgi:hypothetical protein
MLVDQDSGGLRSLSIYIYIYICPSTKLPNSFKWGGALVNWRVPFAGEEYHNWWLVMLTSWCPTFNALRFLYTVYTHSFLSYTCENGQHGYLMESSASLKATQYFNMTNAGKSRSTKEHETHNRHVMISVCNPARRITVNGSANCLIQSAILNHKDLSLKSVRIGVEMQKLWGIKVKIKPSRCRRYQLCRLYVTV